MQKIISVFGSYRPCEGEKEYEFAFELGRGLAEKGFCVMNGGYGGIMEASAKGAVVAGGNTIGVTLSDEAGRRPNEWIKREVKAKNLYERIRCLIEKSDGMVILPGGTGTLAELGIAWDLINKKMILSRPIVCFGDFWKPVVEAIVKNYPHAGRSIKFLHKIHEIIENISSDLANG